MALPIAATSSRGAKGTMGTMAALCIVAASTAAMLSSGTSFSAFAPPRNAATQAPSPQAVAGSGESSMFTSSSAEATGCPAFPVLIAATLTVLWGRSRPRLSARSASVPTGVLRRITRHVQGSVEGVRVISFETMVTSTLREVVMTELHEGVLALSGLVSATDAGLSEEMELAKGSTDNCYLLHGGTGSIDEHDGAVVLIDIMDARFEEAFLEKLRPYLPRLAELVLTVLDQQHVVALPALAKARDAAGGQGKLKVYCAEPAVQMLHDDPDLKALNLDVRKVESGSHIPVPPSKSEQARAEHQRLRVVLCPTPRFPEALSAFDERNGFLYSGKFFSAHRRVEDLSGDPKWEDLAVDWAHLKDCYFFTESARDAVNQIFQYAGDTDLEDGFDPEEPDIEALAPLHGPVVRKEAWRLMAKYSCWLERKLNVRGCHGSAVIVHASAYGNTKTMADAIARGVEAGGLTVQMLNLEFSDAATVENAIRQADGFAVGSPTLGGQIPIQVKEAVGVMLRVAQSGSTEIPCGVFGSFGWSGEAVPEINIRLMDGGFKSAFDPIQCKMKPKAQDLKICEEAGTRLAQKITEGKSRAREAKLKRQLEAAQKRSARRTGEQVDSMEKAFGRIINSSCMITLKLSSQDEQLRLPISWVSQASFEPPGIMLAIEQTDIDNFLLVPVDEQMGALFKKYDKDNSGHLDREEILFMLDELWGLTPGEETGAGFQEKRAEAMAQLDENGDGVVDIDEFRKEATSGRLAEQISLQRRLTALQAMVGGEESEHMKFTVSVLPSGMSAADAMGASFAKKAKTSNGCGVINGAIAFLECRAVQAVPSGSCILLYCHVEAGKVLDPVSKAGLLDEEGRVVLVEASANVKVPAMAAGQRCPSAADVGSRFAGASLHRGRRHITATPRRALALAGEEVLTKEDSWTGLTPGKEYSLQTQCQEVAENTRTIRSLDWQRDRFDIEFVLTHGTTYNAYTIRGAEKTALIDSSHKKFESQFMGVLETPTGGAIDLASLDYIIVSHTEPDHSGLIERLVLEAKARGNDKLIIVGAKTCIMFLKALIHIDFKSQIVKGGDKIDLGGGHVLDFVIAPNLHWPDTMFTYDNKTKLLYTCDAFGMHYCSKSITDAEGVDELAPHFQLYYNCLMKPNARSVVSAIKKVGQLPGDVEAIMTGHGPVLVQDKDHWVGQYQTWSEDALKNLGPSMCIFWVSRYGAAEERAQAFALGATSADVLVEMQDLNAVDAFEIVEAVHRNQVIIVFAPAMGKAGKAAQRALGSVIAACAPKHNSFIVCQSGGEAEEPVDAIVSRFVQVGIPEALPVLRVSGSTTHSVALNLFEATARDLGKKLREKTKKAAKDKVTQATIEALGKVSSGRYIITASRDGVASAAIATWVMPASRTPPIVAVAIAKDSDVNSLMHSRDAFVLNLLAEGAYTDSLKHFQQDFAPGSDVFAGIDTTEIRVPGGGQGIVIRGCGGHVTCRVVSRTEAADHDIVTGEVVEGEMVKDVPVAVNHRKSGAYY